jgi:hypothetical protein
MLLFEQISTSKQTINILKLREKKMVITFEQQSKTKKMMKMNLDRIHQHLL